MCSCCRSSRVRDSVSAVSVCGRKEWGELSFGGRRVRFRFEYVFFGYWYLLCGCSDFVLVSVAFLEFVWSF